MIEDDEVSISSLQSEEENIPKTKNVDEEVENDDDGSFINDEEDEVASLLSGDDDDYMDMDNGEFDIMPASDENSDAENDGLVDSEEGDSENDDDDEDEDDEDELQKMDLLDKQNIVSNYHPELLHHNNEEIEALSKIVRNENGMIVDPLHKTMPFITKYEKARVLGERAKQLNMGAKPLVEIGPEVIDGYLIALKEMEEKKIPFIIKRPLPSGGCEYWKCKDLEVC